MLRITILFYLLGANHLVILDSKTSKCFIDILGFEWLSCSQHSMKNEASTDEVLPNPIGKLSTET